MSRLGRALVPVGWVLLLPVPFLIFWGVGLIHISRAHGVLVEHGVLHDTTAPGVWAALAVVYLVWIVALTVGSIWLLDRLGYHYQPYDRPRRPTRKERRRQRAGLKYQQARQEANRAALREIARESRQAARESEGRGRAAAGGASKRGGVAGGAAGGGPPGREAGGAAGAADQTNGPAHDAAGEGGTETSDRES